MFKVHWWSSYQEKSGGPPNADRSRCLYTLYKKYTTVLLSSQKTSCLYLYGHKNPLPNVWYEDCPLGINAIYPIVKRLYTLAGFTGCKFVNCSCCSTTCTRMFDKNQPEQLIQTVSGHRSSCVHTYKRLSVSYVTRPVRQFRVKSLHLILNPRLLAQRMIKFVLNLQTNQICQISKLLSLKFAHLNVKNRVRCVYLIAFVVWFLQ